MPRLHNFIIAIGAGGLVVLVLAGIVGQSVPAPVSAKPDRPLTLYAPHATNLLVNPDFEDGYYIPDPTKNSIRIPNGWQIKWYTDVSSSGFAFLQPETSVLNWVWPNCCADNYPPRIHSGQHAFESGKQWGPQDVTLYQTVGNIPIGAVVTASAWVHAWVSSCNPNPNGKPPEMALSLLAPNADDASNCAPGYWPIDSNFIQVGIDPYGGTGVRKASVVWNRNQAAQPWWGPYDYYSSTISAVAVAQAHTVTMFIRGVTVQPAKFNTVYFDDASLAYSFPFTSSTQVDGEWPLPVTATLRVQSPVSMTQVTVSVDTGEPIEWVSTTPITEGYLSEWRFNPQQPGSHTITLNASELPQPIQQTVNVPQVQSAFRQDRLFPLDAITLTEPIEITFTLYSPITLTEPTATLTDPLGLPLTVTLLGFETVTPTFNYQWLFTPTLTGTHTLAVSATEFTQPLIQSTVAAANRLYLPLILRNVSAP